MKFFVLKDLNLRILDLGEEVSDKMFAMKIITPQEYSSFINAWESVPIKYRKIDYLRTRLALEED